MIKTFAADPVFLGIECGATRTRALITGTGANVVAQIEAGPANLKLVNNRQLVTHFRHLGKGVPEPDAIGNGLAGLRTYADRQRVIDAASAVWPWSCWVAVSDLELALAADGLGSNLNGQDMVRILVLGGTG